MLKAIKAFFLTSRLIINFAYFLAALLIVSGIVLFFGSPVLGPGLPGSDNTNFVTLADWLYRWFPKIPFWYPQQGAGVSFTAFYPILNHLIVVAIAKFFSLQILVAFRYYALISVILTSVGIYFLAVKFTKNQTVALLASIFYPLSPIAWTLFLSWGFFAEHASYFFVAPAIIFFELYLSQVYKSKNTLKSRIFLLLFLFFSVLTLLSHPLTFIGLLTLLVPFFIVYPLILKDRSKALFKKSLLTGSILMGLVIVLSLFFLVPFFRYQKTVSQGAATGKFVANRPLMLQNSIYFKTFFNLDPTPAIYKGLDDKIQDRSAYGWHSVAFPIAISILSLIGFIGSIFLNRRLFALAFANLFSLTIALSPDLLFFFFKTPVLNYLGNWRSMVIPSRLIIPILAGFGCYTIGYLIAYPFRYLSLKSKWKVLKLSSSTLFILVSSILTIVTAIFVLYHFKNWQNNPKYIISYGPEAFYTQYKPDLRNIWGKEIDYCNAYSGWQGPVDKIPVFCSNQDIKETFWLSKIHKACGEIVRDKITTEKSIENLCSGKIASQEINVILEKCQKSSLPPDLSYVCPARVKTLKEQIFSQNIISMLTISDMGKKLITGNEKKLIDKLPNDSNTRLDMSPGLGSLLMGEPFYSDMPELGVYYNQSSLIPLMWNYQITAFYSKSGIWSQPQITDELAKYLGIGYSFISETNVPIKKFEKNWERIGQNPDIFGILGLWRYKESTGLLNVTTKPLILVIGDRKTQAYFRVFHLANMGGISYNDAILVDGGEYAGNMSIQELKKFDAIVMDGYKYKNKKSAWKKLEEYVKTGGSIYINTGWQFVSEDWRGENLPDFFPMSKLEWTDAGRATSFKLGDKKITKDINSQEISPLIYGDKPWTISSGDKSTLRSWAMPILSVQDKPLVTAGSYGQGKVVWTGLDLAGHIGTYEDNPAEIKLYNNLIKYLLEGKPNQEIKASFSRTYPDRIEFTFDQDSTVKTAVYWKEAYHPDFKAKLSINGKEESIPVYKAGPGLVMFILPSLNAGSKIIYEYKTPFIINVSRIISLFTLLIIIAIIIRPRIVDWSINLFSEKRSKLRLKKRIFKHDDEHMNY